MCKKALWKIWGEIERYFPHPYSSVLYIYLSIFHFSLFFFFCCCVQASDRQQSKGWMLVWVDIRIGWLAWHGGMNDSYFIFESWWKKFYSSISLTISWTKIQKYWIKMKENKKKSENITKITMCVRVKHIYWYAKWSLEWMCECWLLHVYLFDKKFRQ